jgi:hypothetical protein
MGGEQVNWFGAGAPPSTDEPSAPSRSAAPSKAAPGKAAPGKGAKPSRALPGKAGSATPKTRPAPEFGPASPAGPGRASFGFSDGPIGGGRATGGVPAQRSRDGGDDADLGGITIRPRTRDDGDLSGITIRSRTGGESTDLNGNVVRPRPAGVDSTDPGNLPIVRTNTADLPDAVPPWSDSTETPTTGPWTPVPFEPAAPRAIGVDGWGSPPAADSAGPSVWASDTTPSTWIDEGPERRTAERNEPTVWSEGPATPTRPRQSRLVTLGMTVLGAIALAAIGLTGVVYYSGPDTEIGDMLPIGGDRGGDQRTATGPLDGRTIATFELLAATDRVKLRIADLGTDLYRISTPEGAGMQPNAEVRDDRLLLDLSRDEAGSGGEIDVVLAAKVRWTLRFSGYAAERIVDTSDGRVDKIELVGGTRRAEMTLDNATGTVPMKITGGIEELLVRAPADSPVRVRVGGGAGTVTAGARTLRDLPPGATLTPKDWQKANRYDVDAVSSITLLKVEERSS